VETVVQIGSRVTRLGEFSPIRQLFTLGNFKTITEVAQMFGLLSSVEKVVFRLRQKMVWATFWATFSPMGQLFTLEN
jgi:hypothetical protein